MGTRAILIILSIFATGVAQADISVGTPDLRILAPTTYSTYRADATELRCEETVSALNPKGQEIIKLCKKDYRACRFEGACVVETANGKIGLAYHSFDEINEQVYFSKVDPKVCPYGYGYVSGKVYKQIKTTHLCLDPFFSVAADLTAYKTGDVLFVPKLVGTVLPTGEIHDGFVIVRDSSTFHEGAGDYRITFFTGFYDAANAQNPFSKLGLTDVDNQIGYRMATAKEAQAVRKKRNFPSLPAKLLEQGK